MNKRSTFFSLLIMIALLGSAQVPQKFNYQAVVRNAQHALIANQDVGFKMSILEGSLEGDPVYVETHAEITNAIGLADLVIGEGTVTSGVFEEILWGSTAMFLKVEVDPTGGSAYEYMGTSQLISVPYALYSGNISSPTRKFTVQEEMGHPVDSALFEVRNAEGQTVFAVYPEGTRVYVLDEEAKGVKGGFAIGGYSRKAKGITQEYMRVTPDSIRMYFDEEATKGSKGGFAIGGYSRNTKGLTDQYFMLKPDSAKFLMVSDQPEDSYSGALSVITKSSFGGEENNSANLFNLTRDNYLIGHRAGEAITSGYSNCFFGYESGTRTREGIRNIFIGERSGHENTTGNFNSFIGFQTGFENRTGSNNVAIGHAAGQENRVGVNNVYIGTDAGLRSPGNHNVYLGSEAGSNNTWGTNNIFIGSAAGFWADSSLANIFIGSSSGFKNSGGAANVFLGNASGIENETGSSNTFIGHESGHYNIDGQLNTFIGSYAGWKNETGGNNVCIGTDAGHSNASGNNNVYIGTRAGANNLVGKDNIFIGFEAGMDQVGDGKLFIDLFSHNSDQALIYGEFYSNKVQVNYQLGVGMMATDNALEVAGEVSKSSPGDWLANSDVRIKREVVDIANACDLISRLRPVTFRYTDQWMQMNPSVKDKVYYNFIAQEYREVFPQSVQEGGGCLEGETVPLLQRDTHPANVVAIKAIQELALQTRELVEQNLEQQAMLEKLQAENETLREMNQEILNLIESLQKP